ncbi:MAG: hypothetical protein ASARMPREDX12_002286 [Alectoria sarmentosa]|nr:MAG: hypothetical protein ASARMPREDX12_002286 [Alectoria sarmentosa]
MKLTHQACLSLLAAVGRAAVVHHSGNSAPVTNPGIKGDVADAAATVAEQCINFTYDDASWTYSNAAPWSGSGTWGSAPQKMCFPTDNSAGGAMFVGTQAHPGGGNTKLECFFPTSGTANCDISLVDGYSVALQCEIEGAASVGGPTDLWATGEPCVDGSEEGETICLNAEGYAPKQSDVTAFFQKGLQNGNNYCIWTDCSQDVFFPVGNTISCHVGHA